jgi:hypothetical protein
MKTVEEYKLMFEKKLQTTNYDEMKIKFKQAYPDDDITWALVMFVSGYEQCMTEWIKKIEGKHD